VKSLCIQYSPPLLSIPPPMPTTTRMLTPSESVGTKSGSATPEPELENYHPFPPPSRLASPDVAATLRSLGFGYRADFIQKTAKMLGDAHGGGSSKRGGGSRKMASYPSKDDDDGRPAGVVEADGGWS